MLVYGKQSSFLLIYISFSLNSKSTVCKDFPVTQVNPDFIGKLEGAGLKFVGSDESGRRMEVMQLATWLVLIHYHEKVSDTLLNSCAGFGVTKPSLLCWCAVSSRIQVETWKTVCLVSRYIIDKSKYIWSTQCSALLHFALHIIGNDELLILLY